MIGLRGQPEALSLTNLFTSQHAWGGGAHRAALQVKSGSGQCLVTCDLQHNTVESAKPEMASSPLLILKLERPLPGSWIFVLQTQENFKKPLFIAKRHHMSGRSPKSKEIFPACMQACEL